MCYISIVILNSWWSSCDRSQQIYSITKLILVPKKDNLNCHWSLFHLVQLCRAILSCHHGWPVWNSSSMTAWGMFQVMASSGSSTGDSSGLYFHDKPRWHLPNLGRLTWVSLSYGGWALDNSIGFCMGVSWWTISRQWFLGATQHLMGASGLMASGWHSWMWSWVCQYCPLPRKCTRYEPLLASQSTAAESHKFLALLRTESLSDKEWGFLSAALAVMISSTLAGILSRWSWSVACMLVSVLYMLWHCALQCLLVQTFCMGAKMCINGCAVACQKG